VLPYDAVDSLPADVPIVIVDMAGNGKVLRALHERVGEGVRYSCLVGITHGGGLEPPRDLPGAKPEFFFAPDYAVQRAKDWGPAVLATRMAEAWRRFLTSPASQLRITRGRGVDEVVQAYRKTLVGSVSPEDGLILSLT
jgi:hypothetical protein